MDPYLLLQLTKKLHLLDFSGDESGSHENLHLLYISLHHYHNMVSYRILGSNMDVS